MHITFEKADVTHIDIVFQWLHEPHMVDFWGNSQEYKDDMLHFIHGRKQHYFYGTTLYWIGLINKEPYCFLLSDILQPNQELPALYKQYLSLSGHTIGLDFGIENKSYLGKKLAAPTLQAFTTFYQHHIDPLADTFFIDPSVNNPRAQAVYQKAGFKLVGTYEVETGAF